MMHDLATILPAVVLLVAVTRGRWLWKRGYRAGFKARGVDAQPELRAEWERGYRFGRWQRQAAEKHIQP